MILTPFTIGDDILNNYFNCVRIIGISTGFSDFAIYSEYKYIIINTYKSIRNFKIDKTKRPWSSINQSHLPMTLRLAYNDLLFYDDISNFTICMGFLCFLRF